MQISRAVWIGVAAIATLALFVTLLPIVGNGDEPVGPATEPDTALPIQLDFGFDRDAEGWEPGFADLPVDGQDDYELVGEWRELPAELGPGGGLFSSGQNQSADLIMYWSSPVEGLVASTPYLVEVIMLLGTNVPSGMEGPGGSPTESVFVKAGAARFEPSTIVDEMGLERLTFAVGIASQDGVDGRVIGTIDNMAVTSDPVSSVPYAPLDLDGTGTGVTATSDEDGRLWILLGIDSGFEGVTGVYIDHLTVLLSPDLG